MPKAHKTDSLLWSFVFASSSSSSSSRRLFSIHTWTHTLSHGIYKVFLTPVCVFVLQVQPATTMTSIMLINGNDMCRGSSQPTLFLFCCCFFFFSILPLSGQPWKSSLPYSLIYFAKKKPEREWEEEDFCFILQSTQHKARQGNVCVVVADMSLKLCSVLIWIASQSASHSLCKCLCVFVCEMLLTPQWRPWFRLNHHAQQFPFGSSKRSKLYLFMAWTAASWSQLLPVDGSLVR